MIHSRVRATAAAATAAAFAIFWLFVLSEAAGTESKSRALLLMVIAVLALLFAGRVWQRAADIARGIYTFTAAAVEGGILGVIVSVAIALHFFDSMQTVTPTATEIFYYQVLPGSAIFGLVLGVGNAVGLFFLARRLLPSQPPRDA